MVTTGTTLTSCALACLLPAALGAVPVRRVAQWGMVSCTYWGAAECRGGARRVVGVDGHLSAAQGDGHAAVLCLAWRGVVGWPHLTAVLCTATPTVRRGPAPCLRASAGAVWADNGWRVVSCPDTYGSSFTKLRGICTCRWMRAHPTMTSSRCCTCTVSRSTAPACPRD